MTKPSGNTTKICIFLSILLVFGIFLGLITSSPMIISIILLLVIIYEVHRTQGEVSAWASFSMLAIIGLELALVALNIKFDIAHFLGTGVESVTGYIVPLGDIRIIFPTIIALLAIILLIRAESPYAKWLATLILIGSLAIILSVDKELFNHLLKIRPQEGFIKIN